MFLRCRWYSGPLIALLLVVCCFLGVEGEKDYYDVLGVGSGEKEAFPFCLMISGVGVVHCGD